MSDEAAAKPTCFIIMPISTPEELVSTYGDDVDHFKHMLKHLFIPAIEAAKFKAISPITQGSAMIMAKIVQNLETADLVLCDMSTHNPNVFFELGIRTAVDKPVCIVKDDLSPKIPFDMGGVHCEDYSPSANIWDIEAQIPKMTDHVLASAKNDSRNPMWRYFGLTQRAELKTPAGTNDRDKLDFIIQELGGIAERIHRLEYHQAAERDSEEEGKRYTLSQVPTALLREIDKIYGIQHVSSIGERELRVVFGEPPTARKINQLTRMGERWKWSINIELPRPGGPRSHLFYGGGEPIPLEGEDSPAEE